LILSCIIIRWGRRSEIPCGAKDFSSEFRHHHPQNDRQRPHRLSLLINDNDARSDHHTGGRKGYLQWFDGIGFEKDPKRYGPIRIVE